MSRKQIKTSYPIVLLVILLALGIDLVASPETGVHGKIVKITSMNALPIDHPEHTIFFFDIDDTLIDSPYMVGSKAWRKYIVEATKETGQNWLGFFSLALAHHLPAALVEPNMLQILSTLQSKGYAVCGLTARARQCWYGISTEVDTLTLSQLEIAGIHFDEGLLKKIHPVLTEDSEYFRGIFFSDEDLKGEYLKELLKHSSELVKKIVFIDDKLSQTESVAAALTELKIKDFICYWYCATDAKSQRFDPLIANIQLYSLFTSNRVISDEEAENIGLQYPEYNTEYYLQQLLLLCKPQLTAMIHECYSSFTSVPAV